ncbi:MAG: LytTR family DNA-binding domain-containing protein [Lachnospiraceae bacterium]|nr:LytTR family DNA-binding domain-containing protein [Lachnospiraceae bacterium]MDE7332797.1 LytTR family DNA-binding domain-containing protein [Lachnospiraceae bacterium]
MIPVYICDDDLFISKRLNKIISDQIMILDSDMGPVRVADTPAKLLEMQMQDKVPAIYFLDIDFPGQISGLKLAQELRRYDPRGFIVFITAHGDLAFETFRLRLEALDYIVKGDFDAMSVRVRDCLSSIQDRLRAEPPGQGRYCTLKLFDTVRHIPVEDILFFEALGYKHALRLHLVDELVEFNSSLDHFAKQLGEEFWRCHRGFLVNRCHIRMVHLKEQIVELDTGEECPLSRKAKAEYKAQI